jgi:twitching motility protein PilT
MIDLINHERAEHIITIEDPIEYLFIEDKSLIEQREVYADTNSFARALRSVLRQDPNVVMVGEMRDLETISSALTLAETGHLVFSTLHTNNAPQTIDRIVDVFPPYQQRQVRVQLANNLLAIISQRLITRIGGGRVVVVEVMKNIPAVGSLIREGKTYQLDSVIQTSAEEGMIPLDKSLAELTKAGMIRFEDALAYANNKKGFKLMMEERI